MPLGQKPFGMHAIVVKHLFCRSYVSDGHKLNSHQLKQDFEILCRCAFDSVCGNGKLYEVEPYMCSWILTHQAYH